MNFGIHNETSLVKDVPTFLQPAETGQRRGGGRGRKWEIVIDLWLQVGHQKLLERSIFVLSLFVS